MKTSRSALTVADLSALVETGSELARRIDLDELLNHIIEQVGKLTDSPDGSVILHNPVRNSLYFAGAWGQSKDALLQDWGEFSAQQVPIGSSKAGEVFLTGRPLVEHAIASDPRHFKAVDEQTKHQTKSMVCVPLDGFDIHAGEKRFGVMQVLNKRSGGYTKRDLEVLQRFATQAALAIRNARLIQDLLAQMGLFRKRDSNMTAPGLLDELNRPAYNETMSVMFADMRGFTQLCQVVHNPARTQILLNEFLALLSDTVLEYDGEVNKLLGDGMLALFRKEDYVLRAVQCAFALAERFPILRQSWRSKINAKIDFLEIGVGIATDEVMIGSVGSDTVRDYTPIGTAVNLAAALEYRARGGKHILVDHLTLNAVQDKVDFEGPETIELKKADQRIGHEYEQYHLKRLKPQLLQGIFNRVFISHDHRDQDFVVGPLDKGIRSFGVTPWYYENEVKPAHNWVTELANGLSNCDCVFVVISRHSAQSRYVREEVEAAWSDARLKDRIIPIIIDETPLEDVFYFLRTRQGIYVDVNQDIAAQIANVLTIQAAPGDSGVKASGDGAGRPVGTGTDRI